MLTPKKPSLMTEPALMLIPDLLDGPSILSISDALLLQQIHYWCKKTFITDDDGDRILCYTYDQWQDQLPFFSTRWLMKIVQKLEAAGWIEVERGASYNRYKMGASSKDPKHANFFAGKLLMTGVGAVKVFPTLAMKFGVVEAIILQTLHIRTYKKADWWVKKTVREWHEDMLPFVGERTLERAFSKLGKLGVLVVEKTTNKGRNSKRLRVNYVGLANALSLQIENEPPKLHTLTAASSLASASSSPASAKNSQMPAISSPLV